MVSEEFLVIKYQFAGRSRHQRRRPSNPLLRADCRDESRAAPDLDVVVFDDALGVLFRLRVIPELERPRRMGRVAIKIQLVEMIFDRTQREGLERATRAAEVRALFHLPVNRAWIRGNEQHLVAARCAVLMFSTIEVRVRHDRAAT